MINSKTWAFLKVLNLSVSDRGIMVQSPFPLSYQNYTLKKCEFMYCGLSLFFDSPLGETCSLNVATADHTAPQHVLVPGRCPSLVLQFSLYQLPNFVTRQAENPCILRMMLCHELTGCQDSFLAKKMGLLKKRGYSTCS